ncbi:hypothetical protein WA588_000106 [Blastocystis sp. NMH]
MNTLQFFVKTAVSVTRCFTPSLSAFSSMFSNPVLTREFSSAGKSKKSVTKRFSFTGTGKLKRYRAGKRHGNTGKSRQLLRDYMRPVYLENGALYSSLKDMIR